MHRASRKSGGSGFFSGDKLDIKLLAKCLSLIAPQWISSHWERLDIRSPLHRFASRTTLLEAALDEVLFTGACLNDLPRQPHLVVNATELRTGSAFRFGTLESGSWHWGKLHRNAVSVAPAVAASAAYPLFLPAFDETLTFDKGGELKNVRVILTDGGIYDNLGLGCLWPDRSEKVSLNVIPVDTIICCSAGYGLRQEPPSQFIFARMLSVFSTVFDRAQNASMAGCTRRSDPAKSRASYFRISGNLTGNCRTLPPTSCAGRRPTPTPPISAPCRTSGSSASACAGNN